MNTRLAAVPPSDFAPPSIRVPFHSHPLLRGGHTQTLAGVYLPSVRSVYRAVQHRVRLADGDQLVLHDDRPPDWRDGDRTAMLIHGLGGTYQSGYMRRIALRLGQIGVRVFRLDLRGAGAGIWLAKLPYHSGRSDDAAAAIRYIADICPGSPTSLIGFSLGGNIALKLLGEIGTGECGNLTSALAIAPPIELKTCCLRIQRRDSRLYDWRFVNFLIGQHHQRLRNVPGTPPIPFKVKPRTLLELDDRFTGPINGFGDAENYYRACSSTSFVPKICKPTLILTAADDPIIPVEIFQRVERPPCVSLHIASGGGHLGFISRGKDDPDRRWMDWRVVDWMVGQSDSKPKLV